MPRLDPAHPPLWRTPTTLQFGVVPVAILIQPEPWQERLVRALEQGVPDAALDMVAVALGAPPGAAERLVARLARALEPAAASAARTVTLQTAEGFPRSTSEAFGAALADAGMTVVQETWRAASAPVSHGSPIVVLAHHLVEPRRAAALMSHDLVHLPVVFTGRGVELGPVVRPGESPCLACVAAHRRDADPSWPLLAAQLVGRPAPVVSRALAVEAGVASAALLSEAARRPAGSSARSLTLRAGSLHRSQRAHRPHADCHCRSLEGSAMPAAPVAPVPTTARAYARPA